MFVYFNLLNSNESLFYTLIKVMIHHLIKMIQTLQKNIFYSGIYLSSVL